MQNGTTHKPLLELSESQRYQAMERFEIVRPFLEEGVPLTTIARETQRDISTLRRWVARYRQQGLVGLARRERADDGQRRIVTREMEQLIEGLALQKPPLSAAAIHRQVVALANNTNQKPPCYALVHQIVHKLPANLVTFAHRGSKAYANRFEMIYRREASRSNEIWQADHTPLDIFVLREGADPTKPWLTIIIDDYSRAIAGYFLSFDAPSAMQTSLALRQAIWRKSDARWQVCGIPEILYTDNGSDFRSNHLEQVAADLKIRLVFSTPGKPRGRGRIERFFKTINQVLLCALPGYQPPGGTMRGKPQLTLSELEAHLHNFLLTDYHQRPHSQTKFSPKERWESGGFLPQMPESLEQLDLLLLTVARPRRVHADGIHFLGMRYVDSTLAGFIGEDVILRYDPRDIAEVRLFHQNRFLCRAVCQELAGETMTLREITQARNQQRRDLRQTINQRQRVVESLLSTRRGEFGQPVPSQEVEPIVPPQTKQIPKLRRYFNE